MKKQEDKKDEELSKFEQQRRAFTKAFLEAHSGKCPVINSLDWGVRVTQ